MRNKIINISTLVLIMILSITNTAISQSLYSSYLGVEDKKSKENWPILFSQDVQSNEIVEFFRFDGARVREPKVSPDGNLIAVLNLYDESTPKVTFLKTLDIITSNAEFLFSMKELIDYNVMDFCFDPTSQYIAFVAGMSHPYPEADFSQVPIGFGILNISDKSIKWVTGGPEKLRNPVIQYCSWPNGGFIYAYGWTNDNNNFYQAAYGLNDITLKLLMKKRNRKIGSTKRIFRIDPLSSEVTTTDLPVDYPHSFSPDGNYYHSTSMFNRVFKTYDSRTGENVAGKIYQIIGDTLYNVGGLLLKPRWLGNSGSILALDIEQPTKRYKRGYLTGPSRWIFDISTMEIIFQEYTNDFSFDIGHYWNGCSKDFIIEKNDEFKLLDSKVVEEISRAVNKVR
ncbi:MAG: hypothetical protein U9N54_03000 [candidate division Zixibacteria bacterium]|nr:hypothetical protein [candidate division Zixibacteria bacterium]